MGWVKKGDVHGMILMRYLDSQLSTFCKKCGASNDLTIHHKKNRKEHPELMFEESNCERLCEKCHRKVHGNEKKRQINLNRNIYKL